MPSMSFLFSVLAKTSMRGSDASATTQAYMVISIPAFDSLMRKSSAISVSSPIGMNSDVLKINVENVRLMTGSHALKPLLS